MIRLAILALLIATPAFACEIGGCGFGPPTSPEWDRARTAQNNARMQSELLLCMRGKISGAQCIAYCDPKSPYAFDRKRFCDAYDNFRAR